MTYPINFNFIKLSLLKCEIKIQIYRKIKIHSFFHFRIYLSMTFHLCMSFYSLAFLNKMVVVLLWCGQVCPLHHKTNIVFINGNLTAACYQHEVLNTEVIPLLRNHRGMQLLHDGDLAHLNCYWAHLIPIFYQNCYFG